MMKNEDKNMISKLLGKVPLFKNLSEDHLKKLASDVSTRHAVKDEVVILQSDTTTDLYIVLKGRVKVTLLSEDGGEYILADLRDGDFFGEMSLIDGEPRSATVVATEDSTFGVLVRKRFIETIQHDPMIALDLLSTLVRKLRQSTAREEGLALLDVRTRLLRFLGGLAQTEGKIDESGCYKIKKRTQQELALRIGASREAVSQLMRALATEKVLHERGAFLFVSPDVIDN